MKKTNSEIDWKVEIPRVNEDIRKPSPLFFLFSAISVSLRSFSFLLRFLGVS